MHQFITKKDGFREVRNKLIVAMISVYVFLILIGLYLVATSKEEADNSWVFSMILLTLVLGFTTYRNIKKQNRMFESFRLTITEDALIREQFNTPTITIPKDSVREITRTPSGIYRIIGNSKLNAIGIPAQIENRDELDHALSRIRPVITKSNWTPLVFLQLAAILSLLIGGCLGLLSEDRTIMTISGIAICSFLVYGFILIQRSQNFDRRMKRLSYLTIFPLLAIMAMVILQWWEV